MHVYRDGSIHLNHGGTEMGQGLHIKVAQVRGRRVRPAARRASSITATNTGKVPNTSATAASSGSDLNGMAAADACRQIKAAAGRAFAAVEFESNAGDVQFADGQVVVAGQQLMPFADLVDRPT